MKLTVQYDNESDGEKVDLGPADIVLLGQEPVSIEDGNIATYMLGSDVTSDEIEEGLDAADWCFTSMRIDDEPDAHAAPRDDTDHGSFEP